MGDAFEQNTGALVDQGIETSLQDFLVGNIPLLYPNLCCLCLDHGFDLRVRDAGACFRIILVETGAGLLTVAAHLNQQGAYAIEFGIIRQVGTTLPRLVAHVQSGQVSHRQRPHRHAKFFQGRIHLARSAAIHQQHLRFATIATEHTIADEAIAHPGQGTDLVYSLANGHGGGQHIVGGLLTTHHFQ